DLLAAPLPSQRLLDALALPRLEIKGVFLDFLDDVFLLHFPLEAPQRVLDRFAVLNSHLCHVAPTSHPGKEFHYPVRSRPKSTRTANNEEGTDLFNGRRQMCDVR